MKINVSTDKKVFEVEYGGRDKWSPNKLIVLAIDYSNACSLADNYLIKKHEHDLNTESIVDKDGGIKNELKEYNIRAVKELATEFIW